MNSAGGQCHDNARCESMWTRMKEETPLWTLSYGGNEHRGSENPHLEILHQLLEQQEAFCTNFLYMTVSDSRGAALEFIPVQAS